MLAPSAPERIVTHSLNSLNLHPKKIVALGDSLVYGFGDPDGGGWVERLRRNWMKLDSAGPVMYNLGVRGDGVQNVAHRLEQEFRHRGELRNRAPDLIVLSVGVNDSACIGRPDGRNYTEFDRFQQQLAELLDQAQQLCPVFFVGMPPIDESKMPFSDFFYYYLLEQYRYKEATRLACEERRIPYLDVFSAWLAQGEAWWKSRLYADGLHPNGQGYQALLQAVLSWDEFGLAVRG